MSRVAALCIDRDELRTQPGSERYRHSVGRRARRALSYVLLAVAVISLLIALRALIAPGERPSAEPPPPTSTGSLPATSTSGSPTPTSVAGSPTETTKSPHVNLAAVSAVVGMVTGVCGL